MIAKKVKQFKTADNGVNRITTTKGIFKYFFINFFQLVFKQRYTLLEVFIKIIFQSIGLQIIFTAKE
jgi:hypothetical protein